MHERDQTIPTGGVAFLNIAVLACSFDDFHIVEVSDPAAPVLIAKQPVASAVRSLDVPAPGRVVAAAGITGLYKFQF